MACWICEEDGGRYDDRHHHIIGVVRCADGDVNAFNDGAKWAVNGADLEEGEKPEPPAWSWWRWNPDPTQEYRGILAIAPGPGRGNWRGALVVVDRTRCGSCDGTRWVDDQNWQPEDYERARGRVIGSGRIPCGICNHGGWDVRDGQAATRWL